MKQKIFNYIKLLRVKHYVKNLLIFFPLVFSQKVFTKGFLTAFKGFIVFNIAASVIYVINDLKDIEKDKSHPTKCNRPLASGAIKKTEAIFTILILSIFMLLGNYLICGWNKLTWLSILGYVALNLLYSLGLKNIALLDVFILMSGYVIRVFYGALIIGVDVSSWLYLTVMAMAFYLGLGKRRNEMLLQGSRSRKVLESYNKDFLDKNMYVCLTMAMVFYSLWSTQVSNSLGNRVMLATIPFVIMISMRYSLCIEQNSDGDPIEVVLKDKPLLIMLIIYILIALVALYGRRFFM